MPQSNRADRPPAEPRPRRRLWVVLVVAAVGILVDQLTKLWAESSLGPGESDSVIGDLIVFRLVYNSGAAFSIGGGATWVFTIVAAAAVVAISWYAVRVRSGWWALSLGLLLGGATTHLGDRLFRPPSFGQGHVVDFIGYGDLFTGNVADIMLFCGAVLVVVLTYTGLRLDGSRHPTGG